MVAIGKIWREFRGKSGENYEKTGNMDFEHPLEQYPRNITPVQTTSQSE